MIAQDLVGKSKAVSEYYNNNTRRFLKFGKNEGTHNIHQALWAQGIEDQEEAVNYANRLVLQELADLSLSEEANVLDLGCGVGASLRYLAAKSKSKAQFLGITLSDIQAEIGTASIAESGLQQRLHIRQGNFLELDAMPSVNLAYAIEAFVHAADAATFFAAIGEKLVPGGRLVIIDDFRTSQAPQNTQERSFIEDFQHGWHAYSLISTAEANAHAAQASLYPVKDQDLTPLLPIGRPRDQAIGLMIKVAGRWMRQSTYFQSLTGGYAKQQCIKHGLVAYRMMVFEKEGKTA